MRYCLYGLFLFLLSAGFPARAADLVDHAKVVGFVPHKALYDIKLAGTRSGSQIINIDGKMLYDWQSACDGWISNHKFNLYYEYTDSPAMRITSDFSTYETFDGKSMNFTSQRKRDGRLFEELRGVATFHENSKGEAIYSLPKDLEFDLPSNSMFPTSHTLNIFEHIKKGTKFYKAVIFDGSDADGPVEINTFIGAPVNAVADLEGSPDIDMALVNTPARKIRLAFFPLANPQSTADYEMTLTFHDNGVVSDMLIEYDDFTISQTLAALERLEGPCEDVESQK